MSRLTIDITDQQHQSLKVLAALLADEGFEVGAESNTGRHRRYSYWLITVIKPSPAFLVKEWQRSVKGVCCTHRCVAKDVTDQDRSRLGDRPDSRRTRQTGNAH